MVQAGIQTRSRIPVPLKIPLPVRQAWGDTAADAFTDWMEVTVLPHMVPRDEYREILSRMDIVESRISSLERAVMQNRLELHQRLDGIRAEFKSELQGMRAEFKSELQGMRAEFKSDLQGMRAEFKSELQEMRTEFKSDLQGMRAEFKSDLHEHQRETRIAIDELRQEMRANSQAMRSQLDVITERMLVQTRWMIGALTVIGTLLTLLLAVGMFVK